MQEQQNSDEFIEQLQKFSGRRLTRTGDVKVLLDVGRSAVNISVLSDLCFLAKFVSQTYKIMRRIGKDGEGYGRLSDLFNENIEKARTLLRRLIEGMSPNAKVHFTDAYTPMTPESLENLLALLYDLSWYKNWQIDHGNAAR